MTPDRMAALHNAAFDHERPWSSAEFTDLLNSPYVRRFSYPNGFALTRTVARESELLTLAVDPHHRRQGIARALLCTWLESVTADADTAFLEVAADNTAAIALYFDLGFTTIATRKGYYARKNGTDIDALILQRAIPHGHGAGFVAFPPESS